MYRLYHFISISEEHEAAPGVAQWNSKEVVLRSFVSFISFRHWTCSMKGNTVDIILHRNTYINNVAGRVSRIEIVC